MAQCEKILDNNQRCSNKAVPGSRYCQTHGRISFKPVAKPADTAPRPAPEPAPRPGAGKQPPGEKKRRRKETPPPPWEARPSASGQPPAFPGLGCWAC